jgi:catecholate siderophore receptor
VDQATARQTRPAANTLIGSLSPDAYYGMASDYNAGQATIASLAHTHRFSHDSELKTQLRTGTFKRDQRAGTVRFAAARCSPAARPWTCPTSVPTPCSPAARS